MSKVGVRPRVIAIANPTTMAGTLTATPFTLITTDYCEMKPMVAKSFQPTPQNPQKTNGPNPVGMPQAVRFLRKRVWPAFVLCLGLIGTLTWIAFLGWGLYRTVQMLLIG
jgi:hypothetical protein